MSKVDNLKPEHRRAMDLLLEGRSVQEVAAACGVHRMTIWQWRQSPEWQEAWLEATGQAVRGAADILRAKAEAAAQTMVEVMEGRGGKQGFQRMQAARAILDSLGVTLAAPEPKAEGESAEAIRNRVRATYGLSIVEKKPDAAA